MARQTGIVDLLDLRVVVEEGGDFAAVAVVLLHSHGQRLGPAGGEPGVERRDDRANGVLQKSDPLSVFRPGRDDHAADAVAVPVYILRRRMHDDLRAPFDRAEKEWTQERVVDDQTNAALARQTA